MAYLDTKDSRIKLLGKTYHARFSCKGVRVQESLHTKNFKVAVELVDDIQNSILLGEDYRKEKGLFEDDWPIFLSDKAKGKIKGKKVRKVREKTLKEYINFGELYFLPFFGGTRVDKIDGDKWEKYVAWVQELRPRKKKDAEGKDVITREPRDPESPVKIFNHWKYLHGFLSWAVATRRIKYIGDIYNPDENDGEDGVGKNYSDEELRKFRDGSITHPQMHLWICMAQYMGMRSSEITQLAKERIDLGAGLIRLKKQDTKTNTSRNVPIHPMVIEKLRAQISRADGSPFVFPNRDDRKRPMDKTGFKKSWQPLRDAVVGMDGGRFHDFRHSYATRAFANPDLNPVLLCKALGMSMKVAMDVYIHFDEKHLEQITQRFQLGAA